MPIQSAIVAFVRIAGYVDIPKVQLLHSSSSRANAVARTARDAGMPEGFESGRGRMVNRLRPRVRSGGGPASTDRLDLFPLYSSPRNPAPSAINSSSASIWAKWISRTAHREHIVATRRRNYQHWASAVDAMPGARALLPLADAAAPYVFPLWVEHPEASYKRIRAAGVPIFRWDEVWPGTPTMDDDCGIDWATHVYQLGCHQDLNLDDLSRMAQAVRQILDVTAAPCHKGIAIRPAAIT